MYNFLEIIQVSITTLTINSQLIDNMSLGIRTEDRRLETFTSMEMNMKVSVQLKTKNNLCGKKDFYFYYISF